MQVFTYSGSCVGFQGERTLDPGATITSTMTWSAEYVAGVPELPGDVPFSVTFVHDRTNGPPTYPPGYIGPMAAWRQEYNQLSVTGHIQIVGTDAGAARHHQVPQFQDRGPAGETIL